MVSIASSLFTFHPHIAYSLCFSIQGLLLFMRHKKARNVGNISSGSHPRCEEMRCSGWAELVTSHRSTTNCQIPKTHKIGSEAQVVEVARSRSRRWAGRGPIIWYLNIRRPWMRITQSPSCCSRVRNRAANKPSAKFSQFGEDPNLASPLLHSPNLQ